MSRGKIIILSGDLGSGKTSLCLKLAERAKDQDLDLAGLVSPGIFQAGIKTGIDVINLRNMERRHLAVLRDQGQTDLKTKRWSFFPEIVDWGNQTLVKAVPCELLIIDELGPLEFNRGEGWIAGLEALDSENFQAALVVIRPSLLINAKQRWKDAQPLNISDSQFRTYSADKLFEDLRL